MLGDINPMASGYVGDVKNFGGRTLIERRIVNPSSPSDIYFRNIPQDFNHLRIIGTVRGSRATTNANVLIQMNGDTGATYYYSYYGYQAGAFGGGQGVAGSGNSFIAQVAGNTAQSGFLGIFETLIPRYNDMYNASGGYYRYWLSNSTYPSNVGGTSTSFMMNGFWGGVAPITQLRIFCESAVTFEQANVSLYGEN